MSDGSSQNFVFNVSGNKNANINTGTGTQITGDGANANTGSGTINVGGQVFGVAELQPVQIVEKMEEVFNGTVSAYPELAGIVPAEPAVQVFEAMKLCAAVTPEEIEAEPQKKVEVESAFTRFKNLVTTYGPQIGKALCKATVAGLRASQITMPLIAASVAFLEPFQADQTAQA